MTTTGNERAEGLPVGMPVELDPETVIRPDGTVFGGSPARLFRLNPAGQEAFSQLRSGVVRTPAAAALARRFSDAGLVHPGRQGLPEDDEGRPSRHGVVTVVVPVRDRAAELDRCLTGLTPAGQRSVAEVVVVDDASLDPAQVAAVAARHGARLVARGVNGGPGPARNLALRSVTTPLVAFLDSDCLPPPGWIDDLVGHFDDPLLAAVAPRIVAGGTDTGTFAGRFSQARPVLDLGGLPARVAPLSRVSYLPTAALILRRRALGDLSGPAGFDEDLRYGEDVDLVWRLLRAGWRVRYDPTVEIGHEEPAGWPALLRRRFAYGTSAALLEERHPGKVAPLVLVAAPASTVAALLARRPLLAAATFAAGYADARAALRKAGAQGDDLLRPLAIGVRETFFGTGRWTSQFALPLALAAAAVPGRRRPGRALAVLALLTASPLREWLRVRPGIDPVRWSAAVLMDDAAYGAGVWAGGLRARSLRAVRPSWKWRLLGSVTKNP
ncbi:mycofactocin biosynthesis glycosyltransferase MftF [Kineosporia sp. J2-2]|uniref:Mycofactocin biosynthesis glycosyltransferase MftF n=1 Tax=Kineosporia corallincola TaxID=2835133 RepID=A0ABS5TQJ8_9ACTN|nr:mycofactocin biosynthesis glycosyltransferase MftF [Kineosporia corallincola]MBT0772496.1 mycofactocin biosynthesis glycosyltransferase MftF [Kineosporia corallincola]